MAAGKPPRRRRAGTSDPLPSDSTKLTVKVPASLHRKLAAYAAWKGVTLDRLVVPVLRRALAGFQLGGSIDERAPAATPEVARDDEPDAPRLAEAG